MPRAYLRLDPSFDERKESYPDGPYAALVATFCLAELQPHRGRFRSLDYLSRLLGKRGRHLRYLVAQGDVVELPGGQVYVDGWDEWQEGDWKVSERVQRIRGRKYVTPDVTVPVTPDVTVGVTAGRHETATAVAVSGSEAVAVTDPVVAYMKLTGQGRPHPKVEERIRVNASRYGHDEWLFAVNQARDIYGSMNDIKNAETIAEERLVGAKADAKRRHDAELAASRITPEEAAAKRAEVQAAIKASMRKVS